MFVVKHFIRVMYAPANKVTETDRTSAKKETSGAQLNTFVDGRESTVLQRALIDSIHQSAPRPGTGVVQRTKEKAWKDYPESESKVKNAQYFMKRLEEVAVNVELRDAVQRLLTAQQALQEAQNQPGRQRKAWQAVDATWQAVDATRQAVDATLKDALHKVGWDFLCSEGKTLDAIGEFINTWNKGGETDLIDVRSFFQFKADLGEATPTERLLVRTDPLLMVDADVTYIGQDNGDNDQLNAEILNFASNWQEGEAVVPQFLTLDLARKHQTWTQQGNEAFITNLRSPYIKICYPGICEELAGNRGWGVRPGKEMGTRTEVNMLLCQGYIFVQPCLLLYKDLCKKGVGVDARRLQRMGVSPQLVVNQGWELDQRTVPPEFNSQSVRRRPIQLEVVSCGPLFNLELDKSLEPPLSLDLQIGMTDFENRIEILHLGVQGFNFHGKKLRAVVPKQLLWPLEDEIIMSGMSTAKCMVAVQPLETNSLLISQSTDWPKSLHVCVCIENPEPKVTIWDWKGLPPPAHQPPAATPSPQALRPLTRGGRRGRWRGGAS